MASLNKVMIIGNLGRDPEVSYTPSGMAVAKFSVATTDFWTDKSTGERKDKTEWHRVVAFAKLAETCGRYLTKGKSIYLEGRLQTTSYEKDGSTRYSTDIVANTIQFLGARGEGGQGGGFQNNNPGNAQGGKAFQNNAAPKNQGNFSHGPGPDFDSFIPPDDDIPF